MIGFFSLILENQHFLILVFWLTVGQEVEVLKQRVHRRDELSFLTPFMDSSRPMGTDGQLPLFHVHPSSVTDPLET